MICFSAMSGFLAALAALLVLMFAGSAAATTPSSLIKIQPGTPNIPAGPPSKLPPQLELFRALSQVATLTNKTSNASVKTTLVAVRHQLLIAGSMPLWPTHSQVLAPPADNQFYAAVSAAEKQLVQLYKSAAKSKSATVSQSALKQIGTEILNVTQRVTSAFLSQAGLPKLGSVTFTRTAAKTVATDKNAATFATTSLGTQLTKIVDHIPASLLTAAEQRGSISSSNTTIQAPWDRISTGTKEQATSKPLVFFGANEYCPYCAVTIWSLTAALARFGTFTGLSVTQSAPGDLTPVKTLTFVGSHYTSKYIKFVPVEPYTNVEIDPLSATSSYKVLEIPTANELNSIVKPYDVLPGYSGFLVPFTYIGGIWTDVGNFISPKAIAGLTWKTIASLFDSSVKSGTKKEKLARIELAGATAIYTAQICQATNGHPSSVCNTKPVQAAAKYLNANPNGIGGQGCPAVADDKTTAHTSRRAC